MTNEETINVGENDEYDNPFGESLSERGHWNEPRRRRPLLKVGMKVEIPKFNRKAHLDDFLDWLHTIKRVFDVKESADEHKVKVVTSLEKTCFYMVETCQEAASSRRKPKIATWEKMKKLLVLKFMPEHYRQEAYIEYHNLSQGSFSMEDYITEFDQMRMQCDVVEEDK
ncbi:hypothetical protein Pint_09578 [Pistacia integerrima]|uniref:Uncharacterized protein n=1 Tax=Pistacia integerrima TaxID=434235 RepID=A0ACC0XJH6_9ROSI|nr:hypothetical protein Pint_09578 [Pistacia integerrima]